MTEKREYHEDQTRKNAAQAYGHELKRASDKNMPVVDESTSSVIGGQAAKPSAKFED